MPWKKEATVLKLHKEFVIMSPDSKAVRQTIRGRVFYRRDWMSCVWSNSLLY
jgi:hypothetical protein